jgi:hypothetical protein
LKATQLVLQKQLHGLRSLAKVTLNGGAHALMQAFVVEN